MNAITYALQQIHFDIPEEILQIKFSAPRALQAVASIDSNIEAAVIRPMVLTDCNVIGGITMYIETNECGIEALENNRYIIHVPKSLTNGKSIVSAFALLANTLYTQTGNNDNLAGTQMHGYMSSSPIIEAGIKGMENLANFNIIQTSALELIGENIIYVQDPMCYLSNCLLKCTIANNINLENLKAPSFPQFGEFCVLGVKRYLYTKLKINLDKGYLYGGQELTSITDIVESYADAKEMYIEQRKRMKKILFMNDSFAYQKFIQSMIPNTM